MEWESQKYLSSRILLTRSARSSFFWSSNAFCSVVSLWMRSFKASKSFAMIWRSQTNPFLIDLSTFFPQPMIAEQGSCKYTEKEGKIFVVQTTFLDWKQEISWTMTFYCEACKTLRSMGYKIAHARFIIKFEKSEMKENQVCFISWKNVQHVHKHLEDK